MTNKEDIDRWLDAPLEKVFRAKYLVENFANTE